MSVIFRKRGLSAFASAGIAIVVSGIVVMAVHGVRDLFAGAVGFSLFAYAFWLVGWHSAVRVDRSGVTVDNMLVRHVIPWDQLTEIGVGNGLVFVLRDGRKIGSVMYGGSVIGALLGYRYTRGVAARMNAAWDKVLEESSPPSALGGSYRRVVGFSPWPPLAILAVMDAIAALSLLAK